MSLANFGQPETATQLGTTLGQSATSLMQLKVTLNTAVSGLVPAQWDGQAATALQEHWKQQANAIERAASTAERLGNQMQRLGATLLEARTDYQRAQVHAANAKCMVTPWDEVVPLPGLSSADFPAAEAAAVKIQVEVTACLDLANGAREEARAVLPLLAMDVSSVVKDLGQAGLQMMYGLGHWGTEMRILGQQDWSTIGSSVLHGVKSFGESIVGGMVTASKYYLDESDFNNAARVAEVEKNVRELNEKLQLTPSSQLVREGTKLGVNVAATVAPIGGAAKAVEWARPCSKTRARPSSRTRRRS
jgi:hypothetical protein